MNDYIIDDRMTAENDADKIIESMTEEERERILKLSYDEQLLAIENYMKKIGI